MKIQSTKAIRFILHWNLWGAVILGLFGLVLIGYAENNRPPDGTTAHVVMDLMMYLEVLLITVPWTWLNVHTLKTLNLLREQADAAARNL